MDSSQNFKPIDVESGEYYFQPTTPSTYQQYQPKIESILSSMKNKLESSKPCILLKPSSSEILTSQHKSFFEEMETLPSDNDTQYSLIFDTVNFVNFISTAEELKSFSKVKQIEQSILSSLLLNKTQPKGTLLILSDFFSSVQIPHVLSQVLGNEFKSKLLIKVYILGKVPLMILYVIQKMGSVTQSSLDIVNEKILSYEVYDDCTITKPISYLVSQIPKVISYMKEMYEMQNYLQSLHPGQSFIFKVRTRFYTDEIDCTMTILDSDDKELISQKNCVALIVGKKYGNDYFYFNKEDLFFLCKQAKASRVIMLKPSPFNTLSTYEFKQIMSNYILLFRFKECNEQSVPIMLLTNEYEETYEVMRGDEYIIRDVFDKNQKELYRHLIYKNNPTDINSEIKLILTSKSKIKQDPSMYIELPTIDKYKNKNLVTCLDVSYLSGIFIKSILCGILFLDVSQFPKENLNILVLGGGIGAINFFFNRLLRGKVNIDSVEKNKKVTEDGQKYFGLNNHSKEYNHNIKLYFQDIKEFIMNNNKEKYYDLIVLNINTVGKKDEDVSPPFSFFEDNVLKKVSTIMNDRGMYILNVMAKSYQGMSNVFDNLNKVFPQIFLIDDNEDLNKIVFCFKKEIPTDEYIKLYQMNCEKLKNSNLCEFSLIESHKKILARVCDTEEFKEILKTKGKKLFSMKNKSK